jgi:integrase/recombinase XerD
VSTPIVRVPVIPSVAIFVRHSTDCPHTGDEVYKRCRCNKHLRWAYGGRQYRKSAKTRSWQIAEERRREIEAQFEAANTTDSNGDVIVEAVTQTTLERAVELFLTDKRSQGTDADFLKKYERELGRLVEFMEKRGVLFPHEMTPECFTEFRAGWNELYPSSTTRAKVQERLRAFLRYCFNSRMIDRIPKLSSIRIVEPPTMPLTDAEYKALLKAIPKEFTGDKAQRVHALIQLMRHSGLAIQDAVTLEQAELKRDSPNGLYRIETSRQKTGTHVSVPLQPAIAEELIAVMNLNGNPQYVFWSGNGKVKTALSNWGNVLRQLFRSAGFPDGHPHQLRDTFAVSLLEKGVPLEEVSKLLGHDSIKTTEKHYAKWVRSRQDRLDALVVKTWRRSHPQ